MDKRDSATIRRFLLLISGIVSLVTDVVLDEFRATISLRVIMVYIVKYEIHTVSLIIIAIRSQAK